MSADAENLVKLSVMMADLQGRLARLEVAARAESGGTAALMRISDPGRAGAQDSGGLMVAHGGDGRLQFEPSNRIWAINTAAEVEADEDVFTPVGMGEEKVRDELSTLVLHEIDGEEVACREFYRVTYVDGVVRKWTGPHYEPYQIGFPYGDAFDCGIEINGAVVTVFDGDRYRSGTHIHIAQTDITITASGQWVALEVDLSSTEPVATVVLWEDLENLPADHDGLVVRPLHKFKLNSGVAYWIEERLMASHYLGMGG